MARGLSCLHEMTENFTTFPNASTVLSAAELTGTLDLRRKLVSTFSAPRSMVSGNVSCYRIQQEMERYVGAPDMNNMSESVVERASLQKVLSDMGRGPRPAM